MSKKIKFLAHEDRNDHGDRVFYVHIEGDDFLTKHACSSNIEEAIGKLVAKDSDRFGIKIVNAGKLPKSLDRANKERIAERIERTRLF